MCGCVEWSFMGRLREASWGRRMRAIDRRVGRAARWLVEEPAVVAAVAAAGAGGGTARWKVVQYDYLEYRPRRSSCRVVIEFFARGPKAGGRRAWVRGVATGTVDCDGGVEFEGVTAAPHHDPDLFGPPAS